MADQNLLESTFVDFVTRLPELLPEGIIDVDLRELHRLDLIAVEEDDKRDGSSITRYFHVIETDDKITLYNKTFVCWIVPQVKQTVATTYVFVAVRDDHGLNLELAFSTSGVYNSSRLILRILERYLEEIRETEQTLEELLADSQ